MKRYSGIELLRIVAMFLVLVVHANFFSLGIPRYNIMTMDGVPSTLIQSIAVVCVNVFVMISGWFRIIPKKEKLIAFLFQIFFFFFCILAVLILFGLESFSFKSLAQCLFLASENWFIKSYLLLFFMSPLLNIYVDNASLREQKITLIFFYVFQFVYGWATPAVGWFASGCSTISFIGLYLLMQYIKKSNVKIFQLGGWLTC